jgi:ABC-type multidrug transport system fused ATPase/permease subunit
MDLTKKIKEFINIFDFVSKKKKLYFILLQIFSILSSLLDTISVGAIVPFIAIASDPINMMKNDKVKYVMELLKINGTKQLIVFITIFFVSLIFFVAIFKWINNYLNLRLTNQIASQLAFKLFNKSLYQPYILHTQRNSSQILFIVSRATEVLNLLINPVVLFINSFFTIFFISIFLIALNPLMIATTLFVFLFFYFSVAVFTKSIIKRESLILSDSSIKTTKSIQEGLGGIRDIILDGTQTFFSTNFKKQDSLIRKSTVLISVITSTPSLVIQTVGISAIAMFVGFLGDKNEFNSGLPLMGALAFGYLRISPALQILYSSWVSIKNVQVNINKVIDFLGEPDLIMYSKNSCDNVIFDKSIEFKDVSFRYSEKLPFVINTLNFTIKKGERIGLVGKTGSGKSTLCDVMMGLLSTSKGYIKIDDTVVQDNNMRSWQNHIAHVPQAIYLCDGTIAENIAFGVSKEKIDYVKVEKVAQKAQIADTISNLEFGFQTIVGERGIRLSGGQRQRLGIARALYKEADVIFLDEATSALDDDTESDLIKAIEGLDNHLTIIMVAHRLTTLKNCNRIFELSNGDLIQYESYQLFMNNHKKPNLILD